MRRYEGGSASATLSSSASHHARAARYWSGVFRKPAGILCKMNGSGRALLRCGWHRAWNSRPQRRSPRPGLRSLVMKTCVRVGLISGLLLAALTATASPARALDRLCDPAFEDCRAILLNYIRAETVGIDIGFWFMEDARYTAALAERVQAGVPVRVIMDLRANDTNLYNASRLQELRNAGIPLRTKKNGGIIHYKMMLFAGQGIVEFSGANFSADAWVFTTPYVNYVDESAYFTDNQSFVHSFMSKFDDLWTNTTTYETYANPPASLLRNYGPSGTYLKDPQLNFPPAESYANRAVGRYNKETQKI